MDKVEVKVTWSLAWSLWWRQMLIGLGVMAIIYIPIILILLALGIMGSFNQFGL